MMVSDDEIDSEENEKPETASTDMRGNLLPRDRQQKTPTYDYAYEKSMSQAEAKLFYHHHQLASRSTDTETFQTSGNSGNQHEDVQKQGKGATDIGSASRISYAVDDSSESQSTQFPRATVPMGQVSASAPKSEAATVASQSAQGYVAQPGIQSNQRHPSRSFSKPQAPPSAVVHDTANSGPGSDPVMSELNAIYSKIRGLLDKRAKYIRLSSQGKGDNPRDYPGWKVYPPPPEPAWEDISDTSNAGSSSYGKRRKMGQDIGEDFDMTELLPLPGESSDVFRLDGNSIYQVYQDEKAADLREPVVQVPSLRDFYMDLEAIIDVSSDGPAKSFAFKRLSYLEGRFQLHALLNEYQEMADSKKVPHRDFYNVRKVDTHVHHSACMNQKHLLRFIKSKMKKSPDEVVVFRDGKHLTLKEVFESINLTAYDLSIDTLDMHVCP